MIRSISLLLVGLAIGLVAGIYFLTAPPDFATQADQRTAGSANQLSADRASTGDSAPVLRVTSINSHQQRLDFYQRAAQANVTELATLIAEVAATADSPARRFTAEILLSRYAEMDPRNALATARQHQFGPALTASVYAVWARSDRDGALDALAGEPDSAIAKNAGLLLVEELGGDNSALLDVLDALPEHIDRLGFQIDVLVAKSVYEPTAAISSAINFAKPADRERALRRIARKLALEDARQALAAGAQIADKGSRLTFQAEAMREWAAADPANVLDYLATTDMSGNDIQQVAGSTFRILAVADPERLMALADQWSGSVGERARHLAIAQWAAHDQQRAMEFVADLPLGRQRDNLLASVARGYGKTDVEAALAWANSLEPKPRGIVQAVIDGLAEEDANRAFDLALTLSSEADKSEALQSVVMRSAYGDQGAANWALDLPAGSARDNVLAAAVAGVAMQGIPDDKLLTAFSNDMARQQAVVNASYRLARVDRAAAERLIQKYVSDPSLRSQVQQNLASMIQ